MNRRVAISITGFFLSIGFIFVWSKLAPENPPQIPHSPGRPEWVPETAVYRTVGRTWIDITADDSGNPKHFVCTFYGNHSADQIESATFELEGKITEIDEVRDLLGFYDGSDIYLKDDRVMYMYFE